MLRTTEELLGLDGRFRGMPRGRSACEAPSTLDREDSSGLGVAGTSYRHCLPNGLALAFRSFSLLQPAFADLRASDSRLADADEQVANAIGRVRRPRSPARSPPATKGTWGSQPRSRDVRLSSDLTDYTGEVQTVLNVRLSDLVTTPSGAEPQTTQDFPFSAPVPCAATTDSTIGSTCSLTTTADTLVPGAVKENLRTTWQLGQIQVYDGGADGVASTTGDNTLFETQGVFVP